MSESSRLTLRLASRDWNPAGSPTIVLAHGMSGTSWEFLPIGERLAGEYRVSAPDLPGFGHSPRDVEGRYTFEDNAEALARFIRDLQRGAVHFAGHSVSARLGIYLARKQPELFRTLTLIDAGAVMGSGLAASSARLTALPDEGERDEVMAAYRTVYAGEEESRYAVRMADYMEPLSESLVRIRRDPLIKTRIAPRPAAQGGPDFWRIWPALPMPLQIIRGANSQMLSTETVEEMLRLKPGVRFVEIPGVGHNVPSAAPDRLAEALMEFVAGK